VAPDEPGRDSWAGFSGCTGGIEILSSDWLP
jgi:hypothetical protein